METDGLLDEATKVHCLVIYDLDKRKKFSCADQPGFTSIDDGLRLLEKADRICGHNAIAFDRPVLLKLYPNLKLPRVFDTLVAARVIWTEITEADHGRIQRGEKFPAKLIGRHSLEAWGYRLGVLKGDFGKTTDWAQWTPAMQSYCEQDVNVTYQLLNLINSKKYSEQALDLEHAFAELMFQQERHGFSFDVEKASSLYAELAGRRTELEQELQSVFPPTREEMKTPAFWECDMCADHHERKGKGKCPTCGCGTLQRGPNKIKEIPFNPGSRDQVAARLIGLGWKPETFSPTGKPQVSEDSLSAFDRPEAKKLNEYFTVSKRIGQVAEGDEAWLKLERKGRIHGRVNSNGAVTGRCTHSKPNVAQTPRIGSPYGKECRSLFRASVGKVLVGADASGLELRCLAHYLSSYDGGAYCKVVCEGDVHTTNQAAFGLPEGKQYRNDCAKGGAYALVYGAADLKLGKTVFPVHLFGAKSDEEYEALGRGAREAFGRGVTGFAELVEAVATKVFGPVIGWSVRTGRKYTKFRGKKKPKLEPGQKAYPIRDKSKGCGYLRGLDGRRLHVRSEHAALNTLLQSAGALIVKLATVIWARKLTSRGYLWGEDFALVAHIHDEIQAECWPHMAEEVGKTFVESIKEAGAIFNFRCPLDGSYAVGNTWADTH